MSPVPFLPDEIDGAQLAVEIAWGANLAAAPSTWTWTDITEDVRYDDGPIEITLGRADEASRSQPAECTMVLDNSTAAYSLGPQSPNWPYVRRNTPVRAQVLTGMGVDLDAADVSYANTADTAALDIVGDLDGRIDLTPDTWRPDTLVVLAAKYLSIDPDRSWALFLRESGELYLVWSTDGLTGSRQFVPSTVPVPEDTGRLALRWTLDVDNGSGGYTVTFYTASSLAGPWTQLGDPVVGLAPTSIHASGADLTVGAGHGGGAIITGASRFTGVVHAMELRNGIDGTVVAAPDFAARRPDYTVPFFTDDVGLVWNFSGEAKFVDPTVFQGYSTGFTPSWNLKGNVPTVSLTANGALRRLQQRKSPTISALTRYLSTLTTPVAYWALEEGKAATQGKPMIGTAPFRFVQNPQLDPPEGKITWAGANDNPALIQAPEIASGGALFATVDPTRLADNWTVTWAQRVSAQSGAQSFWRTTDDEFTVSMTHFTDGSLEVYLTTGPLDSVTLMTHQFAPDDHDDVWHYYALNVRQNGTAAEFFLDVDGVGVDAASVTDTVGPLEQIEFYSPFDTTEPTAIGHVMVLSFDDFLASVKADLADAHAAHVGENAVTRLQRLCDEHGVPLTVTGTSEVLMGPQFPDTFLTLARECETADQGVLYDGMGAGLAYITRDERENAAAALTIDVAATELAPEFAPVDDDQRNVNQVTAQQREGSTAVYEDTDGPLGVNAIGLYDDDIDVNISQPDRLGDYASWLVHLGTVEGYRYPSVSLNMRETPHLAARWLRVAPSTRLDLTGPAAVFASHAAGDIPLLVEGTVQALSPREWTPTALCSRYQPWRIIVLAEETGDTGPNVCHLDTSYSSLVNGVAVGATELLVTSDLVEGFESPDLAVEFDSLGPAWFRDDDQAHTGTWSLRSSPVSDNESSEAIVTVPDGTNQVSFWWHVSSEEGFDFFVFKIDDTIEFVGSGEVPWTQSPTYTVRPGQTLTFGYGKDGSNAAGSDAAWIDDLTFGHLRWTTLADDFPFEIEVGGTVVTVTGITGTSQQQTFTVDPVPRDLPAGAPIQIHDPPVLGL